MRQIKGPSTCYHRGAAERQLAELLDAEAGELLFTPVEGLLADARPTTDLGDFLAPSHQGAAQTDRRPRGDGPRRACRRGRQQRLRPVECLGRWNVRRPGPRLGMGLTREEQLDERVLEFNFAVVEAAQTSECCVTSHTHSARSGRPLYNGWDYLLGGAEPELTFCGGVLSGDDAQA